MNEVQFQLTFSHRTYLFHKKRGSYNITLFKNEFKKKLLKKKMRGSSNPRPPEYGSYHALVFL